MSRRDGPTGYRIDGLLHKVSRATAEAVRRLTSAVGSPQWSSADMLSADLTPLRSSADMLSAVSQTCSLPGVPTETGINIAKRSNALAPKAQIRRQRRGGTIITKQSSAVRKPLSLGDPGRLQVCDTADNMSALLP